MISQYNRKFIFEIVIYKFEKFNGISYFIFYIIDLNLSVIHLKYRRLTRIYIGFDSSVLLVWQSYFSIG